jgi:hypothetical protein
MLTKNRALASDIYTLRPKSQIRLSTVFQSIQERRSNFLFRILPGPNVGRKLKE